MSITTWFWIVFAVIVIAALWFDLHVMGRKGGVSVRAALWMTAGYIVLAALFGAGIWWARGTGPAAEYATAFLLEKALSLDNIFVFLVLFEHFKVPEEHRHRVLFYGVMGALVLRALFIFAGVALISAVHWVIYVFGVVVILSGLKLLFKGDDPPDPDKNPVLRFVRKHVPMTQDYEGGKFFINKNGARCATPLFAVVVMVETTDVIFAVDSIPAVFGITRDPLIVYTSNVFAILGLRALYFALEGLVERFHYLQYGLALVLVLIGVKMLAEAFIHIPTWVTMGSTIGVIAGSMIISLVLSRGKGKGGTQQGQEGGEGRAGSGQS